MEVTNLNFNGPSDVAVQFSVSPAETTDTIEGEGLWRLGLFFSTRGDGGGERHKYQRQILLEEYADMSLTSRYPMYFLDVMAFIDVVGMGCDDWRYVCVEFSKGDNPRPDFGLPLPGGLDYVVSCREFPCIGRPAREGKTLHWVLFY